MADALITLIALAAVAAYLTAGWRIAVRMLPRAWAVARRNWPFREDPAGVVRTNVKAMTFGMAVGWPVYLTVIAVSRRLGAVVDGGDPKALAARIAELETLNEELRRQAGNDPTATI
jgi:hypothetical protein